MNLLKRASTVALGVLLWSAMGLAQAATYYVATTGSNGGNGSAASPWLTIGYGLSKLSGGDTLIVKPGTYYDLANFINANQSNIPNGTASQYTKVMAETPFSVRIMNSRSLAYYDNMLLLRGQYVHVDGFIFDMQNSSNPEYNASIDGNYNKVTRSVFRRAGPVSDYGGWVSIQGSNNLLEDCAGVGAARYGFKIGGPSSTSQNNILRRCVGRVDYSTSTQPKATFTVYGNNSGNNVRGVLFQNCIAVDSRRGPSSGEDTYGGFYFSKNATDVTIQGSIVLNVEAGYAGYFIKEQQGQDIRMEHSIAWGGSGTPAIAGIRAGGSIGPVVLDHVTVGGYASAYYNRDGGSPRTLTNSLFIDNTVLASQDYGWTTMSNNAFSPAGQAQGSGAITNGASLRYVVRAEPGSGLSGTGTDGKDVGANVTRRYGKSGTLWGEAGFDQITTESLWPWQHENAIKTVFAEPNPAPSGAVPSSNDTTRGFAARTDAFGKPMTLTRYVWQFLGNQIPPEIYGSASATTLPAPSGVSATLVK